MTYYYDVPCVFLEGGQGGGVIFFFFFSLHALPSARFALVPTKLLRRCWKSSHASCPPFPFLGVFILHILLCCEQTCLPVWRRMIGEGR